MASPRGQREAIRAEAFGTLVRRLRRGRKENQSKVAKRIPMSAANLSRLELGNQGPPSDEVIERIAIALEADPKDLLRAAGRDAGGPSIERLLLDRLDALGRDLAALGRDMRDVRAAVLGELPKR